MKKLRNIIFFALSVILLVGSFPLAVFASGGTYTYTYNQWVNPVPSPDAYRVSNYILGQHLEFDGENVGAFRSPQDIHVVDNLVYLADSGNSRIIVLEFEEDNSFEVIDIRTYATLNGEQTEFNYPCGIYVSDWERNRGQIWIADTNNNRILHLDENWNVLNEILHPGIYGTSLLPKDREFNPVKLAVDFSGRLFVQTRGVNRGLMEFNPDGVFAGYMGAPPVDPSPWDRFWRFFSTPEQRERRILNVPVEYNNLHIDEEGFIYATTASDGVDPILRLNAMGKDILIRNGAWDLEPAGDLWYGGGANINGPSIFTAVTSLPGNVYVIFDQNRGRLFAYDEQGELLYAWGGPTADVSREGYFTLPTALDSMGYTLFALDGGAGAALTQFTQTEYGSLISKALNMYYQGLYEESYEIWNEVIRLNGNFGPAYLGVARARLRQGNYAEAMEYFKNQNNFDNYGRAFGFYRREWIEQYFWIFATGLGILIIVPPVVKKAIKVWKEIKNS